MSTRVIAAALALTLPLAAQAQGRTRSAGAPTTPPRAAAPAPTAGTAATPRTRAAPDPGRHRAAPPARPGRPVPGSSGWATSPARDQWRRTPYGWSPRGSLPYVSRPYASRPYQSRPLGTRYYGHAYPYVIVVQQPYAYDAGLDPRYEGVTYVDAHVDAYVDASPEPALADAPTVLVPEVHATTGTAPLLVEPLAGSLLRLRWLGADSTVREVALLLADARRRPLVSQVVSEPPYTAVFEHTARAAFIGVTVVHADGASTTTLLPMPAAAAGRDR